MTNREEVYERSMPAETHLAYEAFLKYHGYEHSESLRQAFINGMYEGAAAGMDTHLFRDFLDYFHDKEHEKQYIDE